VIAHCKPNLHDDEPTVLRSDEYNPDQPFVAPPGCLGFRVRIRPHDFAEVFLRFADRTERRTVARKDGRQIPGVLREVNHRPKST
jgi:hypothetical protein